MEDEQRVLAAGYKLDRYELLCPIASGGMASVWLARLRGKRGFEKLYAIKTIKTELISDPRYQQMFLDEARIASGIEHPNVAQILDLGEQDDILYIVMEWIDGESLAKIHRLGLKRGQPIPLGIALRVMANACAGLHAAHTLKDEDDNLLGIVHRDVSPENILVTTNGSVKVIDFGVAKARNRAAGDTVSGVVKGKVRYMAPEQVKAQPVDHRADIWAVGMCLYEIVTSSAREGEDDDVDVLRRLLSNDPVPKMEGLPESLLPIMPVLSRSLVADPEKRFESASAMRKALLAAVDDLGVSAKTEEIADYLSAHLPDLAKKRRSQVTKAVEQAKVRGSSPGSRISDYPPSTANLPANAEEVALAPTLVSDHAQEQSDPARELPPSRTTGGGATLSEQLGDRPKGSNTVYIAGAIIVLAVIGFFVWRGSQTTSTTPTDPNPPPVEASSAPPPETAPTESAPIELGEEPPVVASASASASAKKEVPATAPPPSASVAPAPDSPLHP